MSKQTKNAVSDELTRAAEEVLGDAQLVVDTAEEKIEKVAKPVRNSILKRFPILFLLLVTFGFTATVTGIEQILIQTEVLQNHPGVILMIGIVMLMLTGTLYKKLG